MTNDTVKNGILNFSNRNINNILFYRVFFLRERYRQALMFLLLCFTILLSYNAKAQNGTDTAEKETSDTAVTGRENGYDTSGYFFNWKENTNEAFTQEKIGARISSDTTIQRLRNDDDFWYIKSIEGFKKNITRLRYDRKYRDSLTKAGLLPPDEQVFTEEQNNSNNWISNLIWFIIIAVFVGAVVYFLLSNKINLFSRGVARTNGEEITSEENLFSINYETLLAKYIAEKNYRLAVRILYLQLLKMLSEKNIITFQPQFTNTQYLQQLAGTRFYTKTFLR